MKFSLFSFLALSLCVTACSSSPRHTNYYHRGHTNHGMHIAAGVAGGMLLSHAMHHGPSEYSGNSSNSDHGQNAEAEDRPYPDPNLSPGDTLPVTAADICVRGYTKNVRNVPVSLKRQVYEEYGIAYVRGQDEVDHIISLELGGSNSIKNLFPQPYNQNSHGKRGTHPTPGIGNPAYDGWGAKVKDRLENKLHELICSPGTPEEQNNRMKQAQYEISHDWIAAYKKYLGPTPTTASYRSRY